MSDNSVFKSFSTNNLTFGTTKEFLESNSLVAKFAFLLLVIVLFVFFLKLGINLMNWIFNITGKKYLINGMVNAQEMLIFPQNPDEPNSMTIDRSINEKDGIEFTWSSWIYINNLDYQQNKYKHIFHKGNTEVKTNGLNFPNNAPGLYIVPNTNSLVVMMNTYNTINEEIVIPNIPLNKWINIIIRCKNTTLDVYINGTIARSIELVGVPKQNYGDVVACMNGGFDGYLSNLWYYNYALGITDIQKIVKSGPNTKMIGGSANSMNLKNPDYLSLKWYYSGTGNMYNPTMA